MCVTECNIPLCQFIDLVCHAIDTNTLLNCFYECKLIYDSCPRRFRIEEAMRYILAIPLAHLLALRGNTSVSFNCFGYDNTSS